MALRNTSRPRVLPFCRKKALNRSMVAISGRRSLGGEYIPARQLIQDLLGGFGYAGSLSHSAGLGSGQPSGGQRKFCIFSRNCLKISSNNSNGAASGHHGAGRAFRSRQPSVGCEGQRPALPVATKHLHRKALEFVCFLPAKNRVILGQLRRPPVHSGPESSPLVRRHCHDRVRPGGQF